MNQTIVLPPETNTFEAMGTIYTFEETLSIERYRRFDQFRLEVGFGVSVMDLISVLRKNTEYMDRIASGEKLFSEMAAFNYNTLKGVADLQAKEPFAVWMCTLFFNTEQEDRRYFNLETMRKKITDWTEAGIDMSFFIGKACAMINGFNDAYRTITQLSLGDWITDEVDPSDPGDQPAPPEAV